MNSDHTQSVPPWTWRVLGPAAVGLLLLAVAGISLISAGLFDPRPLGPLQQTLTPGVVQIEGEKQALTWLARPAPPRPFSARLIAAHQDGESDIGYGLQIGSDEGAFAVAVSPLGLVSVWQQGADGRVVTQMPWQPWPHVRRGAEPNEIQIDVDGRSVTVRLNRERLWQGELTPQPDALGLYAESFGRAATVDFRELALFYEQ